MNERLFNSVVGYINHFVQQDLAGAEKDFRQTLTEGGEEYRMDALYYLGLTLYYRGKVRVGSRSLDTWY